MTRGRYTDAAELAALIASDAGVALTDVILTEILQGVRTERDATRVQRRLTAFDVLRLETLDDVTKAAELYRAARREGVTIRRTLDCLIAAVCIRADVPILHADADFGRLASCTPLRTHAAPPLRRNDVGAQVVGGPPDRQADD